MNHDPSMKANIHRLPSFSGFTLLTFLTLVTLSALNPRPSALAQGTAFTYQGRLTDSGGPASGSYDLRFQVFDGSSGNGLIAGPLTNSAAVTNGLFTVVLDFGAAAVPGAERRVQ